MKRAYDMPELQIGLDKVCFVVFKAHEFDVKDGAADDDSGSNPSDDGNLDVLVFRLRRLVPRAEAL